MKKKHFQLKPHTYLLDVDDGLALFRHFGRLVFIKNSLIKKDLLNIFPDLSQISTESSLQKRHKEYLRILNDHKLILWSKSSISKKKLTSDVERLLFQSHSEISDIKFLLSKNKKSVLNVFIAPEINLNLNKIFSDLSFKKVKIINKIPSVIKKSDFEQNKNSINLVIGSWENVNYLKKLNLFFWKNEIPWLLVLLDAFGGQIGPHFSSKDSPCFECLNERRLSFLEEVEFNFHKQASSLRFNPEQNPVGSMLLNASILDAVKVELVKMTINLEALEIKKGAYIFDTFNHSTEYHEVYPVDSCPVCSLDLQQPLRQTNLNSYELFNITKSLKD